MTEMVPGIHQLKIPIPNNPLEYTNSYLVKGTDGYLLIDPGMNTDEAFDTLKRELSEIGIGFKDISQILATHVHGDHYGLTNRVKQLSQASILLHRTDRDLLQTTPVNTEERLQNIERWMLINGVPERVLSKIMKAIREMPKTAPPVPPDITLNGGEIVSTGVFNLQIVWTPGHSPGHICLYEPTQKILFTGDHILPVITPNVSLQFQSELNPMHDFFNSLEAVRHLDVSLVLPAHEHVFNDLPARVEELIEHHEKRNSEILETIQGRKKTAYQIARKITWMPELGGVSFKDLTPSDQRMAVSETLAHLEAIRAGGRIDKSSKDDVIYYRYN